MCPIMETLKAIEEELSKWNQELRRIDEELSRLTTYRTEVERLLEGYRKLHQLMSAASSQEIHPISYSPHRPLHSVGKQDVGAVASMPLATLDDLIEEVLQRTGRTVITPIEIVRIAMREGLWKWASEKSALNSVTKALRNRAEANPERYQLIKKSNNRLYFIVKSKEDEEAQRSHDQALIQNTDAGGEKEMQGHSI